MFISARKIFIILNLVGLFFTSTNVIPLSVAPFLLGSFLVLFVFLRESIPKVSAAAFIYYMISVASLALYDPHAFVDPEFYRWDGNFFVSYLPLLILPFYRNGLDMSKVASRFVLFATPINVVATFYQIIFKPGNSITGAFLSANAFGGFLMTVIAISLSFWIHRRNKLWLLMAVVNSALLLLSYSRGSILGILVGFVFFIAIRRGSVWVVWSSLLFAVMIQVVILSYTYPIYVNNGGAVNQYVYGSGEAAGEKEANVLQRAFESWPRGLYMFLHSPLTGAGVGSVNDLPAVFNNDYFLQFNDTDVRIYSSAHAHNTYLHVLGEQGLIGLLSFLYMWVLVYKQLAKSFHYTELRDALIVIFLSLTVAAFTEHRIPTPSNAFSFFLFFAFYYGSGASRRVLSSHVVASH